MLGEPIPMITGPRHRFEQRCRERGYTLDEVRPCIVAEDGDSITVDETHPAYPRAAKPGFAKPSTPPPDLSRTDAPSFLTKVKNFAVSAAKHVAAGMPMASDEEIIRRHDICMGCEFMKDNACTKCGCPVKRAKEYVSKLSWADQACPVGKWGKALPANKADTDS
jgi:hypothetical protein